MSSLLPPIAWSGFPPSYAPSSLFRASDLCGSLTCPVSRFPLPRSFPAEHGTLPPSSSSEDAFVLPVLNRESPSLFPVPAPLSAVILPDPDEGRSLLCTDMRYSSEAVTLSAGLSLGDSDVLQVCITGQDPIPCLGEGAGKGDPPCRFVPQGGPGRRASPLSLIHI